MVSSTHWLASAAGMSVLERGGNAFDAAAAAGFVLQVVEPHLNGPGGEVPAVFWSVERGEPLALCGQGVAPAAATIQRFAELGHEELVPGTGVLAACVPGAFGGWLLLLQELGTWRLEEVLDRLCAAEGGLLTGQDLAGWRAAIEPVATYEYRGLTVCKTRPWGAGPVGLQQLALLQGFDLGELSEAEFVHVVTECTKLAFADRDALYGDAEVRLDVLLS